MQRRAFLILGGACAAAVPLGVAAWYRDSFRNESVPLQLPNRAPTRLAANTAPGPSPETYSPLVRVNLTPDPVASVKVSLDGPWEARPVGSDRVLAKGDRRAEEAVTTSSTGFRFGGTTLSVSRVEIVPARSPSIWVNGHQYRGSLRLFRKSEGRLIAVNVVPLEEYVASVVNGEMPATFPEEARKVQAILARTYALFRMAEAGGHPEFELFSTTRSQKYLGVQYKTADGRRLAGESEASRRLTAETAGIVCTANGRVFSAYYCAVCGGSTIDGKRVFADAAPVIQSVPCEWCQAAELYRWTTKMTKREASVPLQRFFKEKGQTFGTVVSLSRAGEEDGPATRFNARDGKSSHSISAVELRRTMPSSILHSPFFNVRDEGDSLVFAGRGHGHGVGVCQWGARGLALEQKDCFAILRHYYPGVKFVIVQPPRV